GDERREDQPAQHHPSIRGKPPNWDETRDPPTICLGGPGRTNTHWSAGGQVTRSQRPSGERTTWPNVPVPRKTTRRWLTTPHMALRVERKELAWLGGGDEEAVGRPRCVAVGAEPPG